jgi:hypothetical protein
VVSGFDALSVCGVEGGRGGGEAWVRLARDCLWKPPDLSDKNRWRTKI